MARHHPDASAIPTDDLLLDKTGMQRLLGISGPALDRLVRKGHIPAPIRLTGALLRWRLQTVREWLAQEEAASALGRGEEAAKDGR
jgi:predicted DNA-binding transcriptional regulator AlpA